MSTAIDSITVRRLACGLFAGSVVWSILFCGYILLLELETPVQGSVGRGDAYDQIGALRSVLNFGVPCGAASLCALALLTYRKQLQLWWPIVGSVVLALIIIGSVLYGMRLFDQLPGDYLSDQVWWMKGNH